jgi:phosphoribosylanthranilate isomerase
MTWVKICGVTNVGDAEHVVAAGADAIGLNFVPGSKRRVTLERARELVAAIGDRAEVIAVVADPSDEQVEQLRSSLGIEWLQLHGSEQPSRAAELLPHAFKAVAIGSADDARAAAAFPGERLLVDTKIGGSSGGTGQVFDWHLARTLGQNRQLIVAGGLTPLNVGRAVRELSPFGVDVASGVELSPGHKDPRLVTAFIEAARRPGYSSPPR